MHPRRPTHQPVNVSIVYARPVESEIALLPSAVFPIAIVDDQELVSSEGRPIWSPRPRSRFGGATRRTRKRGPLFARLNPQERFGNRGVPHIDQSLLVGFEGNGDAVGQIMQEVFDGPSNSF